MSLQAVMEELRSKGKEQTRNIYIRHGVPVGCAFGVSIADLKPIAKAIQGQDQLALELYATGNYDARYLAGLVMNGAHMTRRQLQEWAEGAKDMTMISEFTVPWVTVENADARAIALDWINSPEAHIANAGWCTYSALVANRPDKDLDLGEIEQLLDRVVAEIGSAPNRVKYNMNAFVIAVGAYVQPLLVPAKETAEKVGVVLVDMGDTSCKVPLATAYIAKVEAAGRVGQKRKMIRC